MGVHAPPFKSHSRLVNRQRSWHLDTASYSLFMEHKRLNECRAEGTAGLSEGRPTTMIRSYNLAFELLTDLTAKVGALRPRFRSVDGNAPAKQSP